MLEQLEAKIKDLAQKIEQSAAQHNAMIGGMAMLKDLYQEALSAAPLVEAVDPSITPVVNAVEEVVTAVEAVL